MARISDLVVHGGRELVLDGWEGTGFMVLGPLGST